MPSPYNITNIPAPRVEFIDPRTGLMAREWYRFFFNLFNLTGAGTTDTSLADLQVGPPAINDLLGELGITYDQAQLASMMAQYEQATRSLQNQLDTAPAQPQLGTLAAVNEDNVRLIGFSTNPSPPVPVPAPTGTLYWDGNSTLGLQMDQNVLAKIGQSQFTYVKASATITKGQLCKHTGSVGSSGVITVAPTSIGMTDANEIVGVAAENIALNGFGFIQDSGDLRGFDTTGTSVGEVWADGDPLYYNPAYVGGLTNVKPSAPNLKSYVGEVINAGSSGSGSIHVRMSPGSVLGGTDSNVQFGTLADKDLIQYDGALQYWKNVAASSISIGTATNLAGGAAGSVPYQSGAGATTFLSIGTAGQYARVNAGATAPEWASPAALTKTDDTNVTLTLGGNPTTALLNAASITVGWTGTLAATRLNANVVQAVTNDTNVTGSISAQTLTLGWTGQLSLARGGTNANLTASAGSVAYSTATALALNTAGNSGDWLKSAGTSAPTWTAPAALTKTDDTNVTLTLGGSASTALLNAASITVGWTGTLATTRGGTGLSSFTSGGIVYASSTSALATGSALKFDGTNFTTTGSATATAFIPSGSSVPTNGMYLPATNSIAFATNSTHAVRINASQQVLINATSGFSGLTADCKLQVAGTASEYAAALQNSHASAPYGMRIGYTGAAPNGTGSEFIVATDTAATRFTVRSNGGIANYSANNVNLSDKREKTDFAPAKDYLDVICAIPVQTFKYVHQIDNEKNLGVIAQDVQAVAPELVTESNWGTPDAPKLRLSIYQTDLQYALMKCIQELNAKIDCLTQEVNLLKNKG